MLGFGTLSLSAAMQLTGTCRHDGAGLPHLSDCLLCRCSAAWPPQVGRRRGRLSTAACFLPCPGFLSAVIQKLLRLSCSCISALRSRPACGKPRHGGMPPRCLPLPALAAQGLGALFSLVLGLQSVLAATADMAALRTGKGVLQVSFPLSGTPQPAALTGRCRRRTALKGFSGPGGAAGTGRAVCPGTAPVPCLRAGLCRRGHPGRGHRSKGSAHSSAAFTLRGHGLCGSMLVLYFFMIFLSTALLLLAGNGGLG